MSQEGEQKYNAVILEIRAGVGGEEAALFASDLSRMYTRFAQIKNWKVNVLDSSKTEIGGIKDTTIEISGEGAYEMLMNEAGVHRVQRIPATEKAREDTHLDRNRRRLGQALGNEINIRPQDIRSETYKAREQADNTSTKECRR